MIDRELIRSQTDLTDKEYDTIEKIEKGIELYAKLSESDIFIDCFRSDSEGIVVSHGRPKQSLYKKTVIGKKVLPINEPTVFYTKTTGVGMSDAFAVSQEDVMVQQRTIPISYKNRVIAVLIQETDVTDKARLNDKLSQMEDMTEKLSSLGLVKSGVADINLNLDRQNILIQETHHRIKNNLQTITSILNIQRRRINNPETKDILTDNIIRLNSLASMHEIMMVGEDENPDLYEVIEKQIQLLRRIYTDGDRVIRITLEGGHMNLSSDKVQAVSMIVNELIMNAIKHGFKDRISGKIEVKLVFSKLNGTVIVYNDGLAFEEKLDKSNGLGLDIIKTLTENSLKGEYRIETTPKGTFASINFPLNTL